MGDKIINTKNLYALLELEPFLLLSSLVLLAWAFYKIFLREATEERHKSLRAQYKNLFSHFLALAVFFSIYILLQQSESPSLLTRSTSYIAFLAYLWGLIVFIKSSRIIILQYLFLGSMKHGVPVLIVNIFSLILSVVFLFWTANHVFNVQVTPLLATSAAFSLILGLALQDTLGNLFAGIALQIDKVFDIGDWLEIQIGAQRITGQVKEISWRATTLIGWTDEIINIPNRVLAGSQISNFSITDQPILRSQSFRLDYQVNSDLAKKVLIESIKDVPEVRTWPEPLVLITETTDSWLNFKLVYYIDNYGSQYSIGDKVVESGLKFLTANGISTTGPRLKIQNITPG
ncbi:MAG: mechanosensitive ion channel family protein [Pseudobdellovibrionaceae bacterium]|jgi:small-conductance mechanosensitive channel